MPTNPVFADLFDCFVEPDLVVKTPKYRHYSSDRYFPVISQNRMEGEYHAFFSAF